MIDICDLVQNFVYNIYIFNIFSFHRYLGITLDILFRCYLTSLSSVTSEANGKINKNISLQIEGSSFRAYSDLHKMVFIRRKIDIGFKWRKIMLVCLASARDFAPIRQIINFKFH